MVEDAKPGDVEAVVQEELDAANTKVVIEELVSYIRDVPQNLFFCHFLPTDDKTVLRLFRIFVKN